MYETTRGDDTHSRFSVCVFCASSVKEPEALALAREVGEAIGERGWRLVTGGGSVSMMGEVVEGTRAKGGYTLGVIPEKLRAREVADIYSDELVVVDTMRERKRAMDEASDAFIILPGGIGTLEEFFEVWTSRFLGFHNRPVVICDPHGFYAPLLSWLEGLVERGFVQEAAMRALHVSTSPVDTLDVCSGASERR